MNPDVHISRPDSGRVQRDGKSAWISSASINDVQLSAGDNVRFNFTLQFGNVATAVDVQISTDTAFGGVLRLHWSSTAQAKISSLPLVGNDILDLVRILPGFRESDAGSQFDTFAGVPAGMATQPGMDSVSRTADGTTAFFRQQR